MDEFDTCTKENPTLNNQKDVILCDPMMELKERKCILFLSYMYFLTLFLSYVNWSFVEENETMSKLMFCCACISHVTMNLTKVWN